MFGGLKDLAGLAGMMKDLPKMQARLAEVKSHLSELKVEAGSEDGFVLVIANGTMEIESITIDPLLLESPVDANRLQDAIQGTINLALTEARKGAQEKLTSVAQEMGMPLPPGGFEL